MSSTTLKSPRSLRRQDVDAAPARAPRAQARRRMIDPTTCERDYQPDEVEFMQAVEQYKRRSGRQFPTCSELLEVVRSLGYVRPTNV